MSQSSTHYRNLETLTLKTGNFNIHALTEEMDEEKVNFYKTLADIFDYLVRIVRRMLGDLNVKLGREIWYRNCTGPTV